MKVLLTTMMVFLACCMLLPFPSEGATDTPSEDSKSAFCINCHVMEAEYEAWMHSGAHRRKDCVDCHLPNENTFTHYLWKSIDGIWDVIVYHSGRIPEPIKISSHGEKVLQNNCIRCHETTVMLMDQGRKCWACHRRITHMHTGFQETL